MPTKDKAKQAGYAKKHYEANKVQIKARARLFTMAQRVLLRSIIADEKRKPCVVCNGTFPTVCMDFDHGKRNKTRAVSDMAHSGVSVERFMKEIAKCEVVCANCHRIRTHILET